VAARIVFISRKNQQMDAKSTIKKIDVLESEIVDLKGQLPVATSDERVAIQNRITAMQESLTAYVKLLPPPGKNSFPVFEISFITNLITKSALYAFFHHFFFPPANQLLIMLKIDFIFSISFQKFLLSSSISCFLCLEQSGHAIRRW
jgi:hypothetical protein